MAKKISIRSFAMIHTIVGIAIGLILGIIYSIGGLIIDILVTIGIASSSTWGTPGLSHGTILAMGALIAMPIIFGIFGFCIGIAVAIIYNVISKWIPKGIKV